MNILIQQTKAFPHRANSFYWFYYQLIEWLTSHGIDSKLFFCYIETDDYGYKNGLLLPDYYPQFYTPNNLDAVCQFIKENNIKVILDYSHIITGDIKRYYRHIKQRNPSIKIFTMIHNCPSHTTQLQKYKLSIRKRKDIHSIKQCFQWMFPKLYLWMLKKVVTYQNLSAYRTLDEIILLSPAYISEFRKLICIPFADRLSAIPNAIRPIESNIPITKKNREIIFAGRMEPEKAVNKLLKIWEMVQDQLPDWQLTLVGDGSCFHEIRDIIHNRKLQRITLVGYQMAIPYIDRARIICLTSVIEGLPTVFIEAMSMGVVPIGFASFNAIYDIIENGKNGFIVPENAYEKYAAKIIKLANDDPLRIRMATEAYSQKARYSIEHIAPLWVQVFKKHGLIK